MNSEKKEQAIGLAYGIGFLAVGILLTLVGPYVHHELGGLAHAGILLCETLGIALIALAVINMLIEMKDWRNYFERRLQHIVVDRKFIEHLDDDHLKALQVDVMKAFFKDQKIDREGSFLNYFHDRLRKFIAEPFREDVTAELFLEPGANETWKVSVKSSYRCRLARGAIQPDVKWWLQKEEVEEVTSVKLSIAFPDGHPNAGLPVDLADTVKTPSDREKLQKGISLAEHSSVDGLLVMVEAHYVMKQNRFQYWTMAHPTKNFDLVIVYPRECDLQRKTMVVDQEQVRITCGDGYRRIKCDSWVLPGAGVVWRILPPEAA
jgi:hypothetical protein